MRPATPAAEVFTFYVVPPREPSTWSAAVFESPNWNHARTGTQAPVPAFRGTTYGIARRFLRQNTEKTRLKHFLTREGSHGVQERVLRAFSANSALENSQQNAVKEKTKLGINRKQLRMVPRRITGSEIAAAAIGSSLPRGQFRFRRASIEEMRERAFTAGERLCPCTVVCHAEEPVH